MGLDHAQHGGRPWRRALVSALLALSLVCGAGAAMPAQAQPLRDSLFLGPSADHFLDTTGKLGIEAIAAQADGARFTPANGRVANYGAQSNRATVLWLRLKIPALDASVAPEWVLSLDEPRTRRVLLYRPADIGWSATEWHIGQSVFGALGLSRYPAVTLPAASISERTLYLRIETGSSMRAMLWLQAEPVFVAGYARQSTFFGILFGVFVALSVYLAIIGVMTREAAMLLLAGVIMANFSYVAGDRGFVETMLVPGQVYVGRFASILGAILIYAFSLAYAASYLRIRVHFPRVGRVASAFIILVLLAASFEAYSIVVGGAGVRRVLPYLGLASFAVLIGLATLALWRERRRAATFMLCWIPAIAGGFSRVLLDAYPAIGANPVMVNANYFGIGISLFLLAVLTSLDLQTRERRLRETAEASEARFRSFASSASDSFWETDATGRVTVGTGPVSVALGLRHGAGLLDVLRAGGAKSESEVRTIENAMCSGDPFRSVTLPVSTANETRHVSFSATPAYDGGGAFAGYRGIATDVTEERNRREREVQQQKMAAVGQLAGGIAHEINNLLHPIINLSRRVAGEFPTRDERRRYLDIVIDAGVRAGEIVAGVLTTVRPGAGDGAMLPLAEAVRRAGEAIRPIVPDAIRFDLAITAEGGALVGSGEMLQVLTNLVANAIYATGGSGRIAVTLTAADGICALAVSDDGQGMDAETRQRALEPFFTTKDVGQGTGLGLSIVYGIVRGWGGSIDIESEPGRGSRIVIHLPAPERNLPKSIADHGHITA
jgi:signal transduction histidine kinase